MARRSRPAGGPRERGAAQDAASPAAASLASLIRVRAGGADDRAFMATTTRDEFGSDRQALLARGVFSVTEFPALIAEFDGIPVGFLAWDIDDDVAETVVVACKERGLGAGRALMTALHEMAREAGCARLKVVTTDDNESAQAFYEHLGYEVTEVRSGAVDEVRRRFKPEIPDHVHDEIEYGKPV